MRLSDGQCCSVQFKRGLRCSTMICPVTANGSPSIHACQGISAAAGYRNRDGKPLGDPRPGCPSRMRRAPRPQRVPRTPPQQRHGRLDPGTGRGGTPAHPRAAAHACAPAEHLRPGPCPTWRRAEAGPDTVVPARPDGGTQPGLPTMAAHALTSPAVICISGCWTESLLSCRSPSPRRRAGQHRVVGSRATVIDACTPRHQ
jgi:hypothetical protein